MKIKNSIKVNTAVATLFFMSILTAAITVIGYSLYHHSGSDILLIRIQFLNTPIG